jgi:hypothetical protein
MVYKRTHEGDRRGGAYVPPRRFFFADLGVGPKRETIPENAGPHTMIRYRGSGTTDFSFHVTDTP